MRILTLDIETRPHEVHTWGLYNQNVSLSQLQQPSSVLCWAAKWYGQKKIHFESVWKSEEEMVNKAWDLINEADAIVHYNGTSFDIPTLNREFVVRGLSPPQPHKNIDLLKTVRKRFRFASNKLDFVSRELGLTPKVEHEGHQLWVDVLNGNRSAQKKMREYCIGDVYTTEELYAQLLPWIDNHPNHQLYDLEAGCPKCGSSSVTRQGYAYTRDSKFQRYMCKDCGGWSRGNRRFMGVDQKVEL